MCSPFPISELNSEIDNNMVRIFGRNANIQNYSFKAVFSNHSWGYCDAIIWVNHDCGAQWYINSATLLDNGNFSKDITDICTLIYDERSEYFLVSCTDEYVSGKRVQIHLSMRNQ